GCVRRHCQRLDAYRFRRVRSGQRLYQGRPIRSRRLQRSEVNSTQRESSPRPAPQYRWSRPAGVDVAATGLSSSAFRGGHARHRRAREQMQTPMRWGDMRRRAQGLAATVMLIGTLTAAGPTSAYTVYISNEKGNSITVLDSATLEIKQTIPVGQRPRGIILTKDGKYLLVCASDDDTVQILDVVTREIVGNLPSGPDPEQLNIHPSGSPVYVANEDDALMIAIGLAARDAAVESASRLCHAAGGPGGPARRRAGGRRQQPRRQGAGRHLGDLQ